MNRTKPKDNKLSIPYLITLIAIAAAAVFYYGFRALAVILISMIASLVTEFLCVRAKKQKFETDDLSCLPEAALLAFMLPSSVSFLIVIFASVFMTVIGRHVLGNREGRLLPAPVIGYVFAIALKKQSVLSFPNIAGEKELIPEETSLVPSSSANFNASGVFAENFTQLFLGKVTGPMGTGVSGLLLICGIVLFITKKVRIAPFIGIIICTAFFGGVVCKSESYLDSAIYEVCANMVIFGAIYLAGDTDTAPKEFFPGLLYGITTGLVSYFITFLTEKENAIVFAIIICSPIAILCTIPRRKLHKKVTVNNDETEVREA